MLNRSPVLVGAMIVAASVWIGSFVCLTMVSSIARSVLEPSARVEFFRSLGRRYGVIGSISLGGVVAVGLAMTWPPGSWSARGDALGALVLGAVFLTGVGVRQARAMTWLRRYALGPEAPTGIEEQVRVHARLAALLRIAIGVDTLAAIVVLAWTIGK
ncbi:MAG: hypothetical protein ACRDV4_04170 [Acidimicrobiales bacterium]